MKQGQQELTAEEVKAIFFDEGALLEQPKKMYRLSKHSAGRYYYNFNDQGEPIFFISVTNMIKAALPTSPFLIQWIADKGAEAAEEYKDERAGYGTFMHMQFQKLLIDKSLDIDALDQELLEYVTKEGFPRVCVDKWIMDIKKDVLGFAQWLIDSKVEAMAIEVILASKDGYAGAIDLVCKMDVMETGFFGETYKTGDKKGQPKESKQIKRVTAIVDFKSGRKGFYQEHEVQLEAYRRLVEENFAHIKIDKLFNFAPSDWRHVPGYKMKDQSDCPSRAKFQYIVELAKIEKSTMDREITVVSGVVDLTAEKGIDSNFQTVTLGAYVKNKQEEKTNA